MFFITLHLKTFNFIKKHTYIYDKLSHTEEIFP